MTKTQTSISVYKRSGVMGALELIDEIKIGLPPVVDARLYCGQPGKTYVVLEILSFHQETNSCSILVKEFSRKNRA